MITMRRAVVLLSWSIIIEGPTLLAAERDKLPFIAPQETRQVRNAAQAVIEVIRAFRRGEPYETVKKLVEERQIELAAFGLFSGTLVELIETRETFAALSEPETQKVLGRVEASMNLKLGRLEADSQERFALWLQSLSMSDREIVKRAIRFEQATSVPQDGSQEYQEARRALITRTAGNLARFRSWLEPMASPLLPAVSPTSERPASSAARTMGFTWKPVVGTLIVAAVAPSSPAAVAIFYAGDIVRFVEHVQITAPEGFERTVEPYAPGARLKIRIERGSVVLTLWPVVAGRISGPFLVRFGQLNHQDTSEGRRYALNGHPFTGRVIDGREYNQGKLWRTCDWYPNGRLKQETFHGDRLSTTMIRVWDAEGILLGELPHDHGIPSNGLLVRTDDEGRRHRLDASPLRPPAR